MHLAKVLLLSSQISFQRDSQFTSLDLIRQQERSYFDLVVQKIADLRPPVHILCVLWSELCQAVQTKADSFEGKKRSADDHAIGLRRNGLWREENAVERKWKHCDL